MQLIEPFGGSNKVTMSIEEDEKRVAEISGVKKGKELPDVSGRTLKVYHFYLSKNLLLPFDAEYSEETGPLEDTYYGIKVTGLLDIDECPELEFYGLFCEGKQGRRKITIPLAEVEVKQEERNKHLIKDYQMWFWNYR
jgi:hypothetical protein